jgi:hypothetical protein
MRKILVNGLTRDIVRRFADRIESFLMTFNLADMPVAHSGIKLYVAIAKTLLEGADKCTSFIVRNMPCTVIMHPAIKN